MGIELVKISLGGKLVFDKCFKNFGVLAEFGEGGRVRRSTVRLPLVVVDVDMAEGAFDIDQEKAVGCNKGDVYFVGLFFVGAMHLEGMDDGVGIR